METYTQALDELRAMIAWLQASNGGFQYLRVADCRRFMNDYPDP